VIDALFYIKNSKKCFTEKTLQQLPKDNKLILVTAHRRENFGKPLKNICKAIKILAEKNKDVIFVYPVHLNPQVFKPVYSLLGNIRNILLIKPVIYSDFVLLMDKAYYILTDSGGIQEEAPSLSKPVLILRNKTERPEVVEAGCAKIVGTNTSSIIKFSQLLLSSKIYYNRMSIRKNPVGDGRAAMRIKNKVNKIFRI